MGAVEALDRLITAAEPNSQRRDFPCPFITLFGDCKKGAAGCENCEREASGARARPIPSGVMEQLRA
eukprot:408332-Pleurochrysis_carterae.AAC.1